MPFAFSGSPPPPVKISSELAQAPTNSMPTVAQLPSSDAFAAVAQLFQTTQGQQVSSLMTDAGRADATVLASRPPPCAPHRRKCLPSE